MTELAFLGSLLGMPSIFDPMFPATYASFFGSYPSWMKEGVERMKEADLRGSGEESGDTGGDNAPVSPVLSNVRILSVVSCKIDEALMVQVAYLHICIHLFTVCLWF